MDKALCVDQRKASGKAKSKKTWMKSIKVVYISNPRKVNVKASEFRATVQELTGQDADISDPTMFPEIEDVDGQETVPVAGGANNDNELELDLPRTDDEPTPMEQLEDVFAPQLLENFTGLLQSALWYESSHVNMLKGL